MRVLIISHGHPDYSIGGAEVASYTLFKSLQAAGQDAFYLARLPPNIRHHAGTPLMSLRHDSKEMFIHTIGWDEFWLSNTELADFAPAFCSLLEQLQPDVVHFHHMIGFGVESLALVKRTLPAAKLVVTFHEYLSICANHGQMITAARKLCHQATPATCNTCFNHRSPADFFAREHHIRNHLMLADHYVSPSQFLIDRFVAWGLPADRFTMIENGLVSHPPSSRSRKLPEQRNRFAFFGQISEFKGLHVLLEAIGRIPDDVWQGASLSVFGGNLEVQPESFRNRFASLLEGADRRVRFLGSYRQAELPDLMADIDWVIMPSIWWENSPVVIQEAFLHRRPLIVSGIGGMAEKVRDGINGLHTRVGSPESLADAITRALTEADLWPTLSANAAAITDTSTFAAQHLSVYRAAEALAAPEQLLQAA